MPADFAHTKAMTVVEDNGSLGAAFTDDFTDMVDVDDGGAVHADEFFGIERDGQLLDGLADEEALGADVETGVVVGGFDPLDVGGCDECVFASVMNQQAPGVGRLFRRGRKVQRFENGLELLVRREGGFGRDAVFEDCERFFEALRVNGLGEVIDGVDVERLERIVIVGGDEDGGGNVGGAELLQDVEPTGGWHFDIEEEDVY